MTGQPAYTDADVEAAAEALRLWDDVRTTYPEQATAMLDKVAPAIVARAKAEALRDAAEAHRRGRSTHQEPMWPSQLDLMADEIEAGR